LLPTHHPQLATCGYKESVVISFVKLELQKPAIPMPSL
jgi:hypothetical protein